MVVDTMDHAMPHLNQPTYSSAAELHEANMECQSCNNRGAEANAKENNLRCIHKEYQTNAVRWRRGSSVQPISSFLEPRPIDPMKKKFHYMCNSSYEQTQERMLFSTKKKLVSYDALVTTSLTIAEAKQRQSSVEINFAYLLRTKTSALKRWQHL
jgi:hypothetical protein